MIVYCCSDLIFATKVRSTAESLGLTTRPARDAQMLQKRLDRVEDGKPNEPVSAVFIDLEVEQALTLIDQVKRHDAAVPVVVFASHVLTDLLRQAHAHAADHVLTRGAFTARLPELLSQFASAG